MPHPLAAYLNWNIINNLLVYAPLTGLMLLTDGVLMVLIGRLSMSDAVTNGVEPVRLLFRDDSGFVACCVCLFTAVFI